MRVVQFLQVLVLMALLGYGLLTALENPTLLHLPIPFSERELLLSAGSVLLMCLLLGVAYGAFLLLPLLWLGRRERQRDIQRRQQAESNLQAALRARLSGQHGPNAVQEAPAPPQTSSSPSQP